MAEAAKKNTVSLTMSPMQWADMQVIQDVEPVNEGDYACLAEIRDVLNRHGKRERFGVALLHKHFDMADDEVLMEDSDENDRVLTIKPAKKDSGKQTVQTMWRLLDDANLIEAKQECHGSVHGSHLKGMLDVKQECHGSVHGSHLKDLLDCKQECHGSVHGSHLKN